jgi:hypothetical protein
MSKRIAEEQLNEIYKLADTGKSRNDISKSLGISYSSVVAKLRSRNAKPEPTKPEPAIVSFHIDELIAKLKAKFQSDLQHLERVKEIENQMK